MRSLILLIFLLSGFNALAQPSKKNLPKGIFEKDSVQIGALIRYTLVHKHPKNMEVIFPDSTQDFYPFEYVSRRFYPTTTTNNISLDSTEYILRTFEIDKIQKLALPVYILQEKDTIQLLSETDSVILDEQVSVVEDPLKFKANTQPVEVPTKFNYPYFLIGLAGLAALAGLIWLIFGRNIQTAYKLYRMQKNHEQFVKKYNVYIDRFNKTDSLQNMEKAIILWKNYLTKLEDKSINSFTTKEIVSFYDNDEDITTALRLFDKAIYGNIVSEKMADTLTAFYLLHHFADRRYFIIRDLNRNAAAA